MILIVMGVSGSGKTTIGRLLAERLGLPFYDADDFHPAANREKMSRDLPLEDADRWPWLEVLNQHLYGWSAAGPLVLACSALKQSYRNVLQQGLEPITWIYLVADPAETARRLAGRPHAFVRESAAILAGQFRDLEEPALALRVACGPPPEEIVAEILRGWPRLVPPANPPPAVPGGPTGPAPAPAN